MESRRGKWRGEVVPMVLVLVCFFTSILLLLSACAFFSCGSKAIAWAEPDTRSDCSTTDCNSQVLVSRIRRRRQLRTGGGPGSYPPRCMAKCGNCNPCFPVHVPVPPGTPVTTEYYPEAWRCKCGDRLFMP